ncbi:ribokinase [Rhodobacteraceae bacterium 2376]|uniref:Ribokinase n=1 Tax=Rhabdonatronobacter sediminivivens TaxID=2743469 RepID=A0A7Z0I0H3_9RHOB|nr:ribokinase [Rhabdonatronobacter sediminivivens]NYS25662.1 ribokinase [Rhabdonatronobacter sediminivivens]
MTVYCFGSINIDHFYRLPRLPAPGETLAVLDHATGLGGKGANQSVAAARASARTVHLGAVGRDGAGMLERLAALGVDCAGVVQRDDMVTGHAVIMVDDAGENSIVIHPGANRAQDLGAVQAALAQAALGDILLLQNETDLQPEVAELAIGKGLEVIYSAAPFEVEATRAILPFCNMLVLNAVEAAQLSEALDMPLEDLPVETVVVTRGSDGADWIARGAPPIHMPAFAVTAVDTTGAGDCFAGTLAAALDAGLPPTDSMRRATAAAALQVTQHGTAEAMPDADAVAAFLAEQDRA